MGHIHAHSAHDHHGADDPGALIRWPRRYDLTVAFMFAGRGRRFRGHLADRADPISLRQMVDHQAGRHGIERTVREG